MQYEFLIIS